MTVQCVWNLCYTCRKYKAQGLTFKMSDMPSVRLRAHLSAFTRARIDTWGPMNVTIFWRSVKRWICLFTCLSSRGVHLEMAYSLDTSSFIAALSRFQNHRGVSASYHSDNGRNFVGAQGGIGRLHRQFKSVSHPQTLKPPTHIVALQTAGSSAFRA